MSFPRRWHALQCGRNLEHHDATVRVIDDVNIDKCEVARRMIGDLMFQLIKGRWVFAELAAADRTIIAYTEYQPAARLRVEVESGTGRPTMRGSSSEAV